MRTLQKFTRQEVLALSGSTSSNLAFLELNQCVQGERIGSPKKPLCLYTWQQIFAIAASKEIRASLRGNTKGIPSVYRMALNAIAEINSDWKPCNLFIVEQEYHWSEQILADYLMGQVLKKEAPRTLNITFLGQLLWEDIVKEIWTRAERSPAIKYERFCELFPLKL
jgi:hypothetical protein